MFNENAVVPFLKWAGGKRWLTQHPGFKAPTFDGRYIEPFLGGGSIFFALQPRSAILSDINPELVVTYKALRTDYRKVVRHLARHAELHSFDHYYHVRDKFTPRSVAGKAARFLYLNRTCWNGLYRVNYRGKFNVPKGTKSRVLMETDDFAEVSKSLRKAKIVCSDFEAIIDEANSGDLIYADPPYTVHHNYNGFIKYNEVLFTWEDQCRLRDCLMRAKKRGAQVIVSNADHSSIKKLYGGIGDIKIVSRASIISGPTKGRKATTELLICL